MSSFTLSSTTNMFILMVSLSWNKIPISGLRSDHYYCQTVAGFFLCGVLSLTRGRASLLPQSQSAVMSLLSVCVIYILHVMKCVYNIYKTSVLCHSKLSTSDHALSLVIPATTAV
jgi:hypothetical protein